MGMAFGGVNGEFYATTFSHSSPQVEGGHGRVAGVAPGPVVGRRAVTPAIGVTAGAGRARAAVAAAEVLTERGDPGESGHIFQPKQCSLRVLGVKRKRVPWEAFLPSIASSRPCIIHQILCSSLSLSLSVCLSQRSCHRLFKSVSVCLSRSYRRSQDYHHHRGHHSEHRGHRGMYSDHQGGTSFLQSSLTPSLT